jgi:HEAT repeat protein
MVLPVGTEAAVMGLLSTHPSGYVREAAVQRLARLNDGAELPPLLLRANDWVPQVRDRARAALHARVVQAYAEHWVQALPLVLRLRVTGRADGRPLVDAVLALLRASASHNALWKGLHARDSTVRRTSFQLLREHGRPALHALVRDALQSRDAMLRVLAARAAAELDSRALDDVLPALLRDPFRRVRMAGLRLGAQRVGTAVLPELRRALLDRSSTIRADARTALQRLDPMDFAALYRDHVSANGAQLPAAVMGLAETGEAEDAQLLAPLLAHPRAGVRTAALHAITRLTGDASVPTLLRALGDASPRVSRAAAVALRPRLARADAAALGAWLTGPHPAHVRRNALSLLALRNKWDAIVWILHAVSDAEPAVREAATAHLSRWRQRFNRSFSQPTPDQRERIRAALEQAGDALDLEMIDWLRFAAGFPR